MAGLVTVVILRTQLPSQDPHLLLREQAREWALGEPCASPALPMCPQLPGDQQPVGDVMWQLPDTLLSDSEWLGHRT